MNFDDILNKAKNVANMAGKKTGEVVEIAKIRLQISNLNSELENSFQNLGSIVYEFHKSGVENKELLEACVEEIDAYIAELNELNQKVDELKNIVKCSKCGAVNAQDSLYCAKCGAQLTPVPPQPEDIEVEIVDAETVLNEQPVFDGDAVQDTGSSAQQNA